MIIHGHTKIGWKSGTYNSWSGLKDRCTNPNNSKYHLYGGKGITFQESWKEFCNFLADMGVRPEKHSIERIDGTKGYCKENCKWATIEEQNRNTSTNKFITFNGVTKTNEEWAKEVGLAPSTLYNRVFVRGWEIEKSLTQPPRKKQPKRG